MFLIFLSLSLSLLSISLICIREDFALADAEGAAVRFQCTAGEGGVGGWGTGANELLVVAFD